MSNGVCGVKHTEGLTTDGDPLAVSLVDNAVDLLEVIGVRDDLVVGDDVLEGSISDMWPAKGLTVCGTCGRPGNKAG